MTSQMMSKSPTVMLLDENGEILKTIVLSGESYCIGRHAKCDIMVEGTAISRLHAEIVRQGPRFILKDTNSANGTYVNKKPLDGVHWLKDGDEIGLSSPVAMLRFNDWDSTDITIHKLQLDEKRLSFQVNKKELLLTPAEFRLLRLLYDNAGELCIRRRCIEAVINEFDEEQIDLYDYKLNRFMKNIRKKLRRAEPGAEKMIETNRGQGYMLILFSKS